MYEPLSAYTTLKVGGNADVTVVTDTGRLAGIKDPLVIGRGSKLLVSDKGVGGRVVVMRTSEIRIDGALMTADGGAPMPLLSKAALSAGLSGLEWACGIPGSIGGGVVMNAGAFGGAVGDILESVTVYGCGEIKRQDLDMSYRKCAGLPGGVITSVRLRLKAADKREIKDRMAKLALRRAGTQPRGASAGSSFKAAEETAAGYYLERAGMMGMRIGGAEVSSKHANFIINTGRATAEDIHKLILIGKMKVRRTFGVSLEEEIIYLGEF